MSVFYLLIYICHSCVNLFYQSNHVLNLKSPAVQEDLPDTFLFLLLLVSDQPYEAVFSLLCVLITE